MSFAEDLINRIFQSDQKEKKVLDSGTIQRSDAWMRDYRAWKAEKADYILMEIKRNHVQSERELRDDLNFIHLNMNSAKGFRFTPEGLPIEEKEDVFLLQLLKDQVVEIGYRMSNSLYQYEQESGQLRSMEWFYLKPPLKNYTKDPPIDQLYGNVKIELHQGERRFIKLVTTTYNDRTYQTPGSYDEFLSMLLEPMAS